MALKDYISNLSEAKTTEKTLMLKRIATACGVNVSTVYRWANGASTPDKLKMEKISELTGLPVDELFKSASCAKN